MIEAAGVAQNLLPMGNIPKPSGKPANWRTFRFSGIVEIFHFHRNHDISLSMAHQASPVNTPKITK
jgi:hypothetical protein